MTSRRAALVLTAALVVYLVFAAWRGVELVRAGSPVAVALGLAVLVLPILGGWLVWREVRFGFGMQDMGRTLAAEGGLPSADLPRTPSGRVDRDAADAEFEQRRVEVEASPDDWRGWFRLAVAYDDARDRKRARAAMRRAWSLYRAPDRSADGTADRTADRSAERAPGSDGPGGTDGPGG